MDMDSHHIVQSVVRLTEDSEESAPSVEASPCKSPDVIVEEEITEDIAKLDINHPLFVKEGDDKNGAEEQANGEQKKRKDKKKKERDPKETKQWKIKAQRSTMTRPSKLVPHFKKNKDPLIGLEHLTEYQDEDPMVQLMYTCSLCEVKFASENITQLTQHLTGFKHRLAYLKKNIAQLEDPFKDLDIDSFDSLDQLKRSDQSALVTKLAQVMEQKTGRKYKEIDVFVKVTTAHKQGKQFGGMYMGAYGNQAGNYGSRKSKYHPDNAYFGNGAGFYPQGTNYGMYCDPYTSSTGTMLFADVLPLLYRCEIMNEEDAGQALQASNLINKKILEFNTATSWNRKTQSRFEMREHHQHRPHSGHFGNQNNYNNMAGVGSFGNLMNTQRLSAEAMQAKARWGGAGRGKAHVPYNH